MAFVNQNGESISYECRDLMRKLTKDIMQRGCALFVDVVTEKREGVKIYKDYRFVTDGDGFPFPDLKPTEEVERIEAGELLNLYTEQNSIF